MDRILSPKTRPPLKTRELFLFFLIIIQQGGAISDSIASLDGNDLFGHRVQEAAKFAVEDYNQKEYTKLELVRVDKAAYEDALHGSIFYLNLELEVDRGIRGGNDEKHLFMETAVWDIPSINFKLSAGLDFIYDDEAIFLTPKLEPEFRAAAEFAVQNHNREKHTQFELVDVLDCSKASSSDYVAYSPNLLIRDQGKLKIFGTTITRHNLDNVFESTELKFLFDFAHLPWISWKLLSKVSWDFIDGRRVIILESLDSTLIPVIKNDDMIPLLSEIAVKLGEERTRDQLIPFLSKENENVYDHVLRAMAVELGSFLPYVGGIDHAHVLLPLLEALCTVEHPDVRNQAVESLSQIGAQMKQRDVVQWFTPLVKRLAASESFAGRLSSCGLFHIASQMSDQESLKAELCLLYRTLSGDRSPIVRRSAASNLAKFASSLNPSNRVDLFTVLGSQLQSDQDSVRLSAAEGCVGLVKLMKPHDYVNLFLPLIDKLSQDKFWRVRFMIAKQFTELCEAVVPEAGRVYLIPAYIRLLRDKYHDVRRESAKKLIELCRSLDPQLVVEHILPHMQELSSDPSEDVRAALASVIMGIVPVLDLRATNDQLLPIIRSLLEDEDPDVQLNIISNLDPGNQLIARELVGPLISAARALFRNKDWSIRLAVIEQIRPLAIWMMVPGMCATEWNPLIDICVDALSRHEVIAVRLEARKILEAVRHAKADQLSWVSCEPGKAEHEGPVSKVRMKQNMSMQDALEVGYGLRARY